MHNGSPVRVWDPVVRVFHWSLVIAFTVAYVSEGEPLWLHVWTGYLIAGLIAVRLVWGFIGTPHARFSDFVCGPVTAGRYLAAEIIGRARRYLGHNPAGGFMIMLMLGLLLMQIGTGLALQAADEGSGLLAGWIAPSERLEDPLEDIHEVLANGILLLALLHVAGVVIGSLRHRENLVGAMIHGYKDRRDVG